MWRHVVEKCEIEFGKSFKETQSLFNVHQPVHWRLKLLIWIESLIKEAQSLMGKGTCSLGVGASLNNLKGKTRRRKPHLDIGGKTAACTVLGACREVLGIPNPAQSSLKHLEVEKACVELRKNNEACLVGER